MHPLVASFCNGVEKMGWFLLWNKQGINSICSWFKRRRCFSVSAVQRCCCCGRVAGSPCRTTKLFVPRVSWCLQLLILFRALLFTFKHYKCAVSLGFFLRKSYSCYICYKQISFSDVFQSGSFTLEGHLNVQVTSPVARFGFTVASIGDINGDGYEDIAVGAPLEDWLSNSPSFGSIYIFNGDKDNIKSSFSQVCVLLRIASGTP